MKSIPPAPVPATASDDLQTWLAHQEDIALLVAHDLRNPLAAIMANLAFLDVSLGKDAVDAREAVADIRLSSEMLQRMIENAMALARLESPRAGQTVFSPVSLSAVATAAVGRLDTAAQSNNVTLTVVATEDPAVVSGDRAWLELLVENLAGNAIAYARGDRRVVVTVSRRDDQCLLVVADTGDPFGAVERDFSREGQLEIKKIPEARYSRGLALYVVGLIARTLGGTLEAGHANGWTTMTVAFPRVAG